MPTRLREAKCASAYVIVQVGPGGQLLRSFFAGAHFSAPCHQYSGEFVSTILGNRWTGGTPPATADQDVVSVIGVVRFAQGSCVLHGSGPPASSALLQFLDQAGRLGFG